MRVLQIFSTSVGSKILVAFTGLALVGFLVFHLAGNLLLFFGPAEFNGHAHALISNPLIVPAEIGLIAVFVLHIVMAIRHVLWGRRARPQAYAKKRWAGGPSRKSLGSTTMILTGLVMLVFVILHLKTFKYGPVYLSGAGDERDLYRLLVEVFRVPGYVAFYCVCMVLIGLHLRHGISSAAQSLGLMPRTWTGLLLRSGAVLAVIVAVGFLILPLWVFFFLR